MRRTLCIVAAVSLLAVLLIAFQALRPGPEPAALSEREQEKPAQPHVRDAREIKADDPSQYTDSPATSRGPRDEKAHSRSRLDVSKAAISQELREKTREEAQRQPPAAAQTAEALHAALRASNALYDEHATRISERKGVAYNVILRGRCVRDLSPLAEFRTLKRVVLDGYDKTPDLSPLRELPQLWDLCLSDFEELSDLSPIAELSKLRVLKLYKCPNVDDLGPLSRLTELEELTIVSCPKLTDLKPLAKFRKLRKLSLYYCAGISDLRPLGQLEKLQVLVFHQRRPPRDVSALVLLARRGCRIETGRALRSTIERLTKPTDF